jgi:translocation and assembly module TamB
VRLEATREEDGSIALAPFELELPAQKARATLNGRWQPASGAVEARLEWNGARWPLTGRPEYRSGSGSLRLSGGLEAYRLDARAVLGGTGVPHGDWTMSAQGTDKGLRIESLAGQTLGGTLLVQGSLDWAPELAWDLAVAGRQIDPGVQWPGWPGRLQVRLASSGRLADGRLEMSGELTELEGRLRDYPVSGGGRVRLAGEDVRLQDVRLSSGRAQVGIAGEVAREWDIEWHIEAPEVGDLLAGWHGGVEGSGRVRGPREHPGVAGRLAVEDLEAAGLRVARLRGAFDVQGEAAGSLSVEVSAGHLTWSGRSLDRVALNVDGTVASHRARLYGTGTDHAFDLRLAGGWQDAQWTGRLQRLDWTMPETGAWRLAKPAGVSIGVQGQRLDNACWLQDRARLCTTLRRDAGGGAKAVAAVQQVPLSLLQRWLDDDMQLSGSLEARLNVTGEPGAPLLGSAELSVGPGAATFVMGDVPETAAFEGLQAQVRLEEHALSGSGRFSLSKANRIGADWRLPPLVYGSGMATDAPLRVTVKGRVTELALLDVFVEGLEHPSGTLSIDARVQGTLAAPRIEGGAELEGGRVGIYQLGTEVTDVHLGLRAQRDDRLVLTGSAKSGEGVLDVDGILHAESPEGWHGDVTLKGDRFEVVNLPEARALASPDLRVRIRPGRIDLSGKVGIPEAELEPRDFSGTVSPSRDVVLVGEQAPEEETRWDVYTDVTIMLGEHVTFDGFGLNGRIEGELTATDEPKRVTTGRGRLEIVDGTYKAYGQDLKIEQGRLLFVGGPVDNPGLDVRATRKTGEITAGLKVGGTLKAPDFKFYSEPPLSDADTLSYLLLGRPASRTSGGNEAALINAIAKMGMAGANLLGEHSGSPIVLEELGVDRGETQEDASAYIGAYLSPRVYVYYSMGLFNETSRVRVRYDLTERIKLQSETSGEETAGDVIFTLEH